MGGPGSTILGWTNPISLKFEFRIAAMQCLWGWAGDVKFEVHAETFGGVCDFHDACDTGRHSLHLRARNRWLLRSPCRCEPRPCGDAPLVAAGF